MTEKIKISSDRLEVEFSYPGSDYRGMRFDWTGFVTQVTLTTPSVFQNLSRQALEVAAADCVTNSVSISRLAMTKLVRVKCSPSLASVCYDV